MIIESQLCTAHVGVRQTNMALTNLDQANVTMKCYYATFTVV